MNTSATKQIIERFYTALDTLIAMHKLRGVATFCRLYDIDRRNFQAQRRNLDSKIFQPSWLQIMVINYNVNARWLLTGLDKMFE